MSLMSKKTIKILNGSLNNTNHQFWNFKNLSEADAELTLYGTIAQEESWWSDVASSKKFTQDLKNLGDVKNITVKINSGGGDVFAGIAIYAALKDHAAYVIAKIEGLAASIASVIAMAADEIIIPSSSFMMIHNPASAQWGEAKDFRQMAETLDVIKDGIMNAYVAKTGKDKKELSSLMDKETWMTGEMAVEQGFADKVEKESSASNVFMNGNLLIVNGVSHDLSNFKSKPQINNGIEQQETNALSMFQKFMDFIKGAPQDTVENAVAVANITNKEEEISTMEIKNVEELMKAYPDLVNQIKNSSKEEGKKEERSRMQDIEKVAKNIDPTLVNKAKYETFIDAKDLAFEAMQNEGNKGNEYLNTITQETNTSGVNNITPVPKEIKTPQTPKTVDDMIMSAGAKFDRMRRGEK
jgi:ATP-dependent Clp protease protease subunit